MQFVFLTTLEIGSYYTITERLHHVKDCARNFYLLNLQLV